MTNKLSAKMTTALVLTAMLLSALPVHFFNAFAASTGVTLSDSTLSTEVDTQVNFVVTATDDDGNKTPGTYVRVDDGGAGGSFYSGTINGECNDTSPDGDDEFAITNQKGVCYSNSSAGVYTITAQLIDGNGSVTTIGSPETIEITVTEASATPVCDSIDTFANTTFDTFSLGDVDGQNGWSSTGSFDQEIVENTYGYNSFGCQSLRISNAVTSGSFGDQTFAAPFADSVGEIDATAGGFSVGTRNTHYEAEFDIASTKPDAEQSGLFLSVSPDRGDGSRMSYLSFADTAAGIEVTFYDTPGTTNPASFTPTVIDTLDRSEPHTIKFVIDTIDGADNDVVEIYIDGSLAHTGTTWENYFRFDSEASAEQSPRLIKTLLFRASGSAVAGNDGEGFLIDNLSLEASDPFVKETETVEINGDTSAGENQPGWLFNRDATTASEFEFNTDTSSIGEGAAYVFPIDGSLNGNADKFIAEYFPADGAMPTSLFESFTYDFEIGAGGAESDANEFYLNVYTNLTNPTGFYDCRYNFVPSTGSVGSFTTFSVAADTVADTVADRNGASCPATIGELPAGSTIRVFAINLGDTSANDAGVDGYFDNVVVDTKAKTTTFDFEPAEMDGPVVTFITPEKDERVAGTYTISGQATDETGIKDDQIEVWLRPVKDNGKCGGTLATFNPIVDESGNWSFDLVTGDYPDGRYCLDGKAEDVLGNTNGNGTNLKSFVIDSTIPAIAIVMPAVDDEVDTTLLVTGTATDEDGIKDSTVKVHLRPLKTDTGNCGAFIASADAEVVDGEWSTTFDISGFEPGRYCVTVLASDTIGNNNGGGNHVKSFVIVEPAPADDEAPVVTFLTPETGEDVPTTDITGTITDNTNVAQYSFIVTGPEGNNWNTRKWTPGTTSVEFALNLCAEDRLNACVEEDLPDGEYKVRVAAYDGNGNRDISTNITFNLDSSASLVITNPATDGEVIGGEYVFMADYFDDDETVDTINWAIKGESCEANNIGVNLAGFGTEGYVPADYDPETGEITINYDLNNLEDETYCLVINPQETGGQTDTERETRTFVVENAIAMCELEVVSDTGTVVVESNTFAEETWVHSNWSASIANAVWVWFSEFVENPEETEIYTFEETFTVDNPSNAILEVGADNSYRVFINDELVYDKSDQDNNFQGASQDEYTDVVDFLENGENTLRIEVTNNGVENSNYFSNPAGVLYRLTVDAEVGENSCVVTTDLAADEESNGGGGSEEEEDTYGVEGYVYLDEDENGTFASTTDETGAAGWMVQAVNVEDTEDTYSTTTDSTGLYMLELPAGTWTISIVLQDGYEVTDITSYEITVPEDADTVSAEAEFSFAARVMNFLIPTAMAAVIETYQGENFGVVESESNSTGGGFTGGSIGTAQFGLGGGNGLVAGASTTNEPVTGVPQVLGDQVSIVPAGAPNAGAGGMQSVLNVSVLQLLYTRQRVTFLQK